MTHPLRLHSRPYSPGGKANSCILFVGHGSREDEANLHFQENLLAFQRRFPKSPVYGGYIELAEPLYSDVLEGLSLRYSHIRIVPFALFAAGHVKNDIPFTVERLRKAHPSVRYEVSEALGTNPLWVSHLHRLIRDRALPEEESILLVIGRGSSDAGANSAFFHMSRLIGEGLNLRHVIPSFVGITKPNFRDSLRLAAKMRPKHLVVLPYFLYSGVLHKRIRSEIAAWSERYPGSEVVELPPLSDIKGFEDVIADRAFAVDEGQSSHLLPCHSCQYRVALGSLEEQVGGLNSLLYSIRHAVTRQQASPHAHAHAAISKHIFICTSRDCADRSALSLARRLRRRIKDEGQSSRCRVTLTSCMGRCGEGPAVAVYPDGIWYRKMDEVGMDRLVTQHIKNDRIVDDYVDTIL